MAVRAEEFGCAVEMPSDPPEGSVGASAEDVNKYNLPVVILLGWAGCKDQYLMKYSTIYLKKGCIVIRYTAPWRLVFFSESMGIRSLQNLAKKLLELLFAYKMEMKPLLFHVFSNGGVMLYRYIVELLHTHRQFQHLRVVGTVFDSAPGRKNLRGGLRALSVVLESTNVYVKYFLLLSFAVLVVTLRILLYPLTRFVHESHYDAMLKQPSFWPELYLYSRADGVILASDVETMIEARRQRQVPVKAVDFVNSAHVSHLRAHPASYVTHCISFMYSCLDSLK
ncbi:PREDICTED: transmembrane protein 53 [Gekko japonicus]|uniref:Transmembrane protein 53 n=1 Tax=Gekko japonicus TaxID=146911 RepID=A0ABM1JQN9_GEKJA|nr:PREDICTED: transmembrane protein 53 [Gekko japonicus]